MNKIKIINDPVYGFVKIPFEILFEIIEHRYFQRLRRINQLGLTHLVYPGALHTRFHHALGALHLMTQALDTLKLKGIEITEKEYEATCIAILLHDIGHGPFSHTLEGLLISGVHHEELTRHFMKVLNQEFEGKLTLAIQIFEGNYPKIFLHQLISSQLDIDRLDYLRRDSFYTGVYEGTIGSDRIINMLNVYENELVVEAKGIYSIEKFLLARRFMYRQVYLHKTVLSAEQLLINIIKRAKEVLNEKEELFLTQDLSYFMNNEITGTQIATNPEVLDKFAALDDSDITSCIKAWVHHKDFILSTLSKNLINRVLYKVEFFDSKPNQTRLDAMKERASKLYHIPLNLASYYAFSGKIENHIYAPDGFRIKILVDGKPKDLSELTEQYELTTLSKKEVRGFMCYTKELYLA